MPASALLIGVSVASLILTDEYLLLLAGRQRRQRQFLSKTAGIAIVAFGAAHPAPRTSKRCSHAAREVVLDMGEEGGPLAYSPRLKFARRLASPNSLSDVGHCGVAGVLASRASQAWLAN